MGNVTYTTIGIDLGNFDTKSQDTITPNGYTLHTVRPSMANEYLYYNGKYYCPCENRFNYKEDKTATERALILALFGISKQLLYRAKQGKTVESDRIQEKLNKTKNVVLGFGLPLTHMSNAESTQRYFEDYFNEGVEYIFNGYHISFRMIYSGVFPQNYAAICTNSDDDIIKRYKTFWAADLGGGTLDLLQIINGLPDVGNCITENHGSLYMYKNISQAIKRDFNIKLSDVDIEQILKKQPNVLAESRPEVKEEIHRLTQSWVDDKIIDFMSQNNVNFDTSFIIFFGGFSLLLKPFILKNKLIKNVHFLKNPVKANARAYAALAEKLYLEERG